MLNVSYGDIIDFSVDKEKIVLRKHNPLTSARTVRGILKAKRHYTDREINRATGR
jgi:hypothetical protein